MNTPETIAVYGRRFFDSYGNTYHSVHVHATFKDGPAFNAILPYAYGYGDQYQQSAHGILAACGVLPESERYSSGARQSLWGYCRDHSIDFTAEVSDGRKKDLHDKGKGDPYFWTGDNRDGYQPVPDNWPVLA